VSGSGLLRRRTGEQRMGRCRRRRRRVLPHNHPLYAYGFGRSTHPGQAAPAAQRPGSLTAALPTPWSGPMAHATAPRRAWGVYSTRRGIPCLECGLSPPATCAARGPPVWAWLAPPPRTRLPETDAASRTEAGSATLTWMSSPKPQHKAHRPWRADEQAEIHRSGPQPGRRLPAASRVMARTGR
jgi:hypothetical protein